MNVGKADQRGEMEGQNHAATEHAVGKWERPIIEPRKVMLEEREIVRKVEVLMEHRLTRQCPLRQLENRASLEGLAC